LYVEQTPYLNAAAAVAAADDDDEKEEEKGREERGQCFSADLSKFR